MRCGLCESCIRARKKLTEVARAHAQGLIEVPGQRKAEQDAVAEAAAIFGLRPEFEGVVVEPLYLWPENLESWQIYQALQTSWKEDAWGDPAISAHDLESMLRMSGVRRGDQKVKMQDIQAMQREARKAWREKRANG